MVTAIVQSLEIYKGMSRMVSDTVYMLLVVSGFHVQSSKFAWTKTFNFTFQHSKLIIKLKLPTFNMITNS